MASSFVNPLSQTVPQALLIQISTLPSAEVDPPTSLSSPLVQLAAKVEISVQKKYAINYTHSQEHVYGVYPA